MLVLRVVDHLVLVILHVLDVRLCDVLVLVVVDLVQDSLGHGSGFRGLL